MIGRSYRFADRVIAVTGAYGGFGREFVKRITNEGGKVVAIGRDDNKLKELQNEFGCYIVEANISEPADQTEVVEALMDLDADSLVNNAGTFIEANCTEFTRDGYHKVMKTNLEAPMFISQGIANHWMECNETADEPRMHNIVNISSCASLSPLRGHILYGLSKSGIDYITKHMALEYGGKNIQVNSVNPTVIKSEMGTGPRGYWGNMLRRKWALDRIPMGRFGEVEEVTSIVCYLLSNECPYINGVNIPVEGGLLNGSSNNETYNEILSNIDPSMVQEDDIKQLKKELAELEAKYDEIKKQKGNGDDSDDTFSEYDTNKDWL